MFVIKSMLPVELTLKTLNKHRDIFRRSVFAIAFQKVFENAKKLKIKFKDCLKFV